MIDAPWWVLFPLAVVAAWCLGAWFAAFVILHHWREDEER
jgi:hypothetical protein